MEKQPNPPGQPPSLREIAQRNNPPSAFPEQPAYDRQAGVPVGPGTSANQKYKDAAAGLTPGGGARRPADKSPIKK